MDLPEKFQAAIGGFMGPSFSIELVDEVLEYRQARGSYEFDEPQYLRPSRGSGQISGRSLMRLVFGTGNRQPTQTSGPPTKIRE